MTKALVNTLLFEAGSLGVSALALVLGKPAVALLVFATSHFPGSLLLFPALIAASSLFDDHIRRGGPWASLLPLLGVGVVVGIQVPVLLALFHWHRAGSRVVREGHGTGANGSLGVFAVASVEAALVVLACLSPTPIRTSGNCVPLLPGEPPPKPIWQLSRPSVAMVRPFDTLRTNRGPSLRREWWGVVELRSPWRFGMLGLYVVIGFAHALWTAATWRRHARAPRAASGANGAAARSGRRFQYSLRTLLLVVTAASAFASLYMWVGPIAIWFVVPLVCYGVAFAKRWPPVVGVAATVGVLYVAASYVTPHFVL